MYNLTNIHTAPSYDALKRNGFTDIDVIAYYGTPIENRASVFKSIKLGIKPQVNIANVKATPDIDSVRNMALEYMTKDFIYRGQSFNMKQLGWRFAFNDRKRALGLCSFRNKTIYLSDWFIGHNTREMKMWVNTMIHEIAHAYNYYYFGGRGHDNRWRNIFIELGGDGRRTAIDAEFSQDLIAKPISKYTNVCPNGHQFPAYKYSIRIEESRLACSKCCNEHNNGNFDKRFLLKQIKNY